MKDNSYRTNMVKKAMGIMAAMALSASLLAGCGQDSEDTDGVRDTMANSGDMAGNRLSES